MELVDGIVQMHDVTNISLGEDDYQLKVVVDIFPSHPIFPRLVPPGTVAGLFHLPAGEMLGFKNLDPDIAKKQAEALHELFRKHHPTSTENPINK